MANYNEEENQRIGRELHRRDIDQNQRYSYRPRQDRKWDEGNFFHTGPSPRGAQDRENMNRNTGSSSQGTYHRGEGAHLNDHYGSRPNSAYRNERSYLNHGDTFGSSQGYGRQQGSGSQPGNYNEPASHPYELWNDVPGGRSRYKETDFRYGSGSHNWYREGRFTPDEVPENMRDNRGFFTRLKDTWNDIMHSDDPDYRRERNYPSDKDRRNLRKRYGNELYNRQQFDRGYEGGPRWADEVDSGKDNYYDDTDRTQRYRR
ncbi:hypothetical protein [Pontibacter burrus]|uniref:Uncharacterized protein n=1 Tax=Pontibacter burrus TaxID=2704466 RepID=A0A6B3LT40_9BACT|nr:hypothetical protein [Pontibacter burrus]NEM96641.1 hypothetical protein [Pontibacter burrus]